MNVRAPINSIYSYIVFSLIGFYCLFASMYYRAFAEINVQLPFLSFPIFIGEIILGACLILLMSQWKKIFIPFQLWHRILLAYVAWILIKAFLGYRFGGALAFRNAALFYYALFAVIGYCFYNPELFSRIKGKLLLTGMLFAKYIPSINNYYVFPYLMTTMILAQSIQTKWLKYMAFLLVIYTPPYNIVPKTITSLDFFFSGGRARVLGHMVAFLFLLIALSAIYVRIRREYRKFLIGGLIILGAVGILKFSDPNARMSLTNLSQMKAKYNEIIAIVNRKKDFQMEELPISLYSKKDIPFQVTFKKSVRKITPATRDEELVKEAELADEVRAILARKDLTRLKEQKEHVRQLLVKKKMEKELTVDQAYAMGSDRSKPRKLTTAYSNIFFRFFLWRDMLVEIIHEKALFGINFGKPQRSRTIEALNWGSSEWEKDGWITPHNSWFHYIYRAGVVGIGIVVGIFYAVVWLAKRFIKMKSLNGILLTSVFVYWIVVANFTVFLELPYNAIPFWTLGGMTFAYCQSQTTKV